jgi:hypothetical protein
MPVLRTPSNKLIYLLLLNLSLFGTMPSIVEYFQVCQKRGDYPVQADSIGIPIFFGAIGIVVLSPILSTVVYLLLRRSRLPAPLIAQFKSTDIKGFLVYLLVSFFMVYEWISLLSEVASAGWMRLPSLVVAIYLVWSVRAGRMNRANRN